MPCPTRINCRHDRMKVKSAVCTGDDVATIPKSSVVVFAPIVGVPEINHCAGERAAASCQNEPRQFDPTPAGAKLAQVTALGGTRLEEWPLALTYGGFIAVVTCGRRSKLLR